MLTEPMRLGALSLDDLTALNGTLGALAAAGQLLVTAGLIPTFDLTPRYPMQIAVNYAMPVSVDAVDLIDTLTNGTPAPGQTGAALLKGGGADVARESRDGGVLAGCTPIAVAELTTDFAVQAPSLSGQAEAPAVGPIAGAPLQSKPSATFIHVGSERPAVAEVGDDRRWARIVVPPTKDGEQAQDVQTDYARPGGDTGAREAPAAAANNAAGVKGMPDRWTDAEDVRALEIYGAALRLGVTKDAAHLAVAKELGRPVLGVRFRFRNKLVERADRLTVAILLKKAGPATLPQPEEKPKVAGAAPVALPQPEGPHPARIAAKAPTSPPSADIAGHLATLPVARGWDSAWDVGLVEMACDGLDMGAIAADLRSDAGAVKARFDALTGLYKDANDKACRRFTREQVRDQLTATAAAAGA